MASRASDEIVAKYKLKFEYMAEVLEFVIILSINVNKIIIYIVHLFKILFHTCDIFYFHAGITRDICNIFHFQKIMVNKK